MMSNQERKHRHEHVDESELWKRKTLTSAENRRRFAKFMNLLLIVVATLVVAACVFAYFIDE